MKLFLLISAGLRGAFVLRPKAFLFVYPLTALRPFLLLEPGQLLELAEKHTLAD